MKMAVQGLERTPVTVLSVLEQEKPEVSHVICSDYQLKHVATGAGFDKPNEEVVKEAAKKFGIEIVFHTCDIFDPLEVGGKLGKILGEVDSKKDELIINYAGETAVVKLLLGTMGVLASTVMKTKVLYAVTYPARLELSEDHTGVLRDIFQRLKMTA
jgi:hypothetical protein